MKTYEISINSHVLTRSLWTIAFLLVCASILGQISKYIYGHPHLKGFVPLFDLDGERNIPTFFTTFLMLAAALMLAVIYMLNSKQKNPYALKWKTLSYGFIFMAYDEAFQVHELLIKPFREFLGGSDLGIFYYAWVLPGIFIVCFMAMYFLKFLLHLQKRSRFGFLLAAALYLGGCIGFELVGGQYHELFGKHNLTYSLITAY